MDQKQPISPDSDDLQTVLRQLSTEQIRFVIARGECKSDKEAAAMIGISHATPKRWNDDGSKALVDTAVRLMVQDGVITAMELRRRALSKAMAIKAAGLDSDNERIRQDVATEIVEWEMGKATARTEAKLTGEIRIVADL